jgi:homoserine kinase type II
MEDELQRVLGYYDLGEPRVAWRVERGFVNVNWVVETAMGHYFVKCRHPSLRRPDVIRAQHELVAHLRQKGFPAPAIVPATSGETLTVLGDEFYEVQSHVEGSPFDHDRPLHFEAAAGMLGRYHASVAGFAAEPLRQGDLYSPAILHENLASLVEAWKLEREPDLAKVAGQLEARADDLAGRFAHHDGLAHLVIHGDYYAGNLVFEGDRIVAVVDYDKARWQPRVVELAEALIYFASPRPGSLKHLVYSGTLQWEPLMRFVRRYARVITLSESEARALPDYVRCIWMSVSLQHLSENPRPAEAREALQEVLALGDWAAANAQRMTDLVHAAAKELK